MDRSVSDRGAEADRHPEAAEAILDRRTELVGRSALRHGAEHDPAHAVEHARLAELDQHPVDAPERALADVLEERDLPGEAGRERRPGERRDDGETAAEERPLRLTRHDRARDLDPPARVARGDAEQVVERAGVAGGDQVVRHHGTVQRAHPGVLHEELQQGGRIAEPDAELGVPAHPGGIDVGQDPGDPVAAARAPDRPHLGVGERVEEAAPAFGIAGREVRVAVRRTRQADVESALDEHRGATRQPLGIDLAGGCDHGHPVARAQRRRLDQPRCIHAPSPHRTKVRAQS